MLQRLDCIMTDANTKIELRPTKEVVNKTFAKLNK